MRLTNRVVLMEGDLADDPLDIFHAYAGPHVAWRRVIGDDWRNSHVFIDGVCVGPGEDPRLMMAKGLPLLMAVDTSDIPWITRSGWNGYMSEVPAHGKNFVPFTFNNQMGVVTHYDPPRGVFGKEPFEGVGNRSQMHGGFSAYRGGTNGFQFGDVVMGVGHKTDKEASILFHIPFGWVLDPKDWSMTISDMRMPPFDGYPLVDPTSFDGRHVWTCEASGPWADRVGKYRSCRYDLDLS